MRKLSFSKFSSYIAVVFVGFVFGAHVTSAVSQPFGGLAGIGQILNKAATDPGFATGPLGGSGQPVVKNQDANGGNDVDVPDVSEYSLDQGVGGGSTSEGSTVNSADINSQIGGNANIAVISPMNSFNETMNSSKQAGILSASVTANGQLLSPLALSFQAWESASPQTAASLNRALEFAMGFTNQRYLAEQNADIAFRSAGEGGRKLSEAYRRCVAQLVQGSKADGSDGKTYAAAQEACLKQSDVRTITNASKDENVSVNDILSYKYHPSHPIYSGQRSVLVDGNWTTKVVNNQDAVRDIFNDPREDLDPKTIKLTHLLFVPTVVNASTGAFQNGAQVTFMIKQLVGDWKRIFGDIKYVYQGGGTPNNSFMSTAVKRVAPSFKYADAIKWYGIKGANPNTPAITNLSGFDQFVKFKTHYAYYTLWQVMAKRCHVEGTDQAGSFWTPVPFGDPASAQHITEDEVQRLSSSFSIFNKDVGQDLYTYATGLVPKGSAETLCDILDPAASTSTTSVNSQSGYGKNETSINKLISQGQAATFGIASARTFFLNYAAIIARDQINTTTNNAYQIVASLTGGDFEAEARVAGINLIADVTHKQFGADSVSQAYRSLYYNQLLPSLKNKITMSQSVSDPTKSGH